MVPLERTLQTGMTLIEVLVATLILSGGLLGAAAVQLKALQHTGSALMTTQANFIAYDMLDRARANSGADYSYSTGLRSATAVGAGSVLAQDLSDFARNIHQFGGERAHGAIEVRNRQASITLEWDDARASPQPDSLHTFMLAGQIASVSSDDAS